MVGIVTGQGAGLERSSASVLGQRGQVGAAGMGRGGDHVFVNAATGNLVINRRDEFLVGRGPDTGYAQTYDSSGLPQYAWMQGVHRVLSNLTGTVNTAGSTITRGDGDGHNSLYTYDSARGAYVTTEGGGSHDELRNVGGAWTWTDGDSRMTETYTTLSGVPGYHFVATLADADGNTQSYSWYSNGTIQRITNANGEYAEFTQTNGLPTQITTYSSGAATLTRVRYTWDSLRRLSSVIVDLSPGDHSIADGKTYTTNYTYDGSSSRITTITQSDGSRLDIAYTQSGSEFRVTKLTQTVAGATTRVTGLFYDLPSRTTTITDALGGATVMRYDQAGNLIQVTHPVPAPGATAPTTSFGYNSNGDVISVTEAGRTTTYTYDSRGNMTSSRDWAGNTVTRTYGSKNELLTSTQYLVPDPDGAGSATAGTPVTTRYAYDVENHLRFTVSGDGRVTEYRYDAFGMLTSTLRYTADYYNTTGLAATSSIAESSLIAWANGISDKTTIERIDSSYDFRGNVSATTAFSKTLSDGNGDWSAPYTRLTYSYDQAGNLLSRQNLGLTGSETFLYDGLNRIVSSTDAGGALSTITFDDAATTTTVAVSGGVTRVSVFNKAGERISHTESGSDVLAATSTSGYDALGRLRMTTDATGKSTYFFYDSASRKIAEITGEGAMTEYGYDSANRLVKSVSYLNRLSTSQIALLSSVSPGGAGGSNSGGVNGPTGSTLLMNGSFEQSGTYTPTPTGRSNTNLPGWTKANAETFEQVTSGQMGVMASDGSFWLDLESIAKTGVMAIGSNLLVNGGFEQSGTGFTTTTTGRSNTTLPGWAKTNAEAFEQVTSGQMGVTASEGSFWLDMESVARSGMMVVGSNLLVNGSFGQSGTYVDTATGRSSTTIPGWTKTNPETFETVNSGQMGVTTLDGGSWLDLESTATTGPQAVGGNLVVNGSFEQSTTYTQTSTGRSATVIPGWSKANPENFDQVLAETTEINATDGLYFLDLDSTMGGGGTVSGPNLLVNGSFEQSATTWTATSTGRLNSSTQNIPGWVKLNDQGFEQMNSGAMGIAASNGSFYLDMEATPGAESRMDISQTVANMTAGQQLTLKFDYANIAGTVLDHEGSPENSGALEVYWNGLKIGIVSSADPAMTTKTFNVSSVEGNNTLRFREIGMADGKGVYLDNVQLYANVPAPSGGNMNIYQTIPNLAAGQVMQLRFDYSSRTTAASGSFEVWWNNTLLETISDGAGLMKAKSYFVSAVAGNNTIRFKGIGTVDALGGAIDNVRLFATQTPPHGGNMDISQTVGGLSAGQVMQLQFDHANRTTAASGTFEVYWNNVLVATIAETNTTMLTKTYQLTAVAGNNTLRFKSLGPVDAAGASLDNVRLFAMAPVPTGGNMDISQTVSGLTAGNTMQLQFDHANRTGTSSGSFEVWWNGTLVATVNETNPAMQTKTYLVTALAGNNTLRFKSLGTVDDAGASIDNVRLFATQPVPTGGNMDISQTVGGLTAGQTMQLQFDHANRTNGSSGHFEVYWNGALVATVNETGTMMRSKTYYVTAVTGNNTLRFRGIGQVDDAGASIDNVRLFAMQGGGPVSSTPTDPLIPLRPAASAGDDWTWRIYDSADRLIETIDATGAATIFAYDGASRLVSSTAYANAILASTVAGYKTATPTAMVVPAPNSVADRSTRTFYDSEGRVVGTLDGAGGLTQIFHDAAGQKIREISYSNPVLASLRASGSFATLVGNVGSTTSDRRVDYVYDQRGLVRYTIDALGHPTEFVYDSAGQLIRTVDYGGSIATNSSYSLSYVQSQIGWALTSSPSTRVTRTVYDGAGRAAFTIDSEGGTASFAYDSFGNPVKETRYAAAFTTGGDQTLAQMQAWAANRSGDVGNRVTRRIHDSAGRLAYTVDAEGFVTERRYDTAGRLTHSIAYPTAYSVGDWATKSSLAAQIGAMPATAVMTIYAYDGAGRLLQVTDGTGVVTRYVYDGLGQVTNEIVAYGTTDSATVNRSYDAAGRVTGETRGHGTAEAATTSYGYDALGNLLTVVDARNHTTSRTYDALGRVLSVTSPIDASTSAVTTHAYNRFGDVVQTIDARGYSTYTYYDRLGRSIATRDAEDYVTETGYNVFGDVTTVTRRYNKAGNAASSSVFPTFVADSSKDATTGFQYDRLGRLTRTTDAMGKYEQYTLNAFGDRVTVVNKLGGIVTNTYDKRGLQLSETLPMRSIDMQGNILAETVTNRFEYDSRGNRTKRIEADGLPEKRTTIFAYDKADRLIETRKDQVPVLSQGDHNWITYVAPIDTIRYDARGNAVETVDSNGARTLFYYDKLNRKIAEIGAAGTLSTWAYDKNGNVVSARVYATAVPHPSNPGGTPPPAPAGEYRETTYTHDRLNRIKTSSLTAARNGAWFSGAYYSSVGNLVTTFEYDSNGNVTKTTDANGGISYTLYDKLNRAYGKIDAEGYATVFIYDSEGNVVTERRYATRAYNIGTATPGVNAHADDRHTDFTYDKNGNRLTEKRHSVAYSTGDIFASLTDHVGTVTITYTYNGLGQVTSKTEASGDYVDYAYDKSGRLLTESRSGYYDTDGYWIRPTVQYSYDGLNNLTMTRQGGETESFGDRYTRYQYAEGGRLARLVDAAGANRYYAYDTAGNLLRESYYREKSDGSTPYEAVLYTRDSLGRITSQGLAVWNGSAWSRGDSQNIAYNAFGEVAQRGLNGLWQEQFAYDNRGKLWRTNSGDGVWRYFVYDGNGVQTLMLESEGLDLAGLTIDQALAVATQYGSSTVGASYVDGLNATINVLDKRGMTVTTRLPKRQLSEAGGVQDLTASRGYNAFGEAAWERDAKGYQTNYVYNTMGRNVSIQRPGVWITKEDGTYHWVTPTENFSYDASGRLVGMEDSNGNKSSRTLLEGTGYGGGEALVTAERHADGGISRTFYDKFGDARNVTNELMQDTVLSYDAMGRLVAQSHRGGLLTEYFAYDLLGQRIRHWNSHLGSWNVATTDYDLQGRVVREVAFGGDVTTTSYSWSSSLTTSGMGTFGGWTQTTTYANFRSMTEQSDVFGRNTYKSDLGNHTFTFNYDLAGRMIQRAGGETLNYSYLNSGALGSVTKGHGTVGYGNDYNIHKTIYGYDANGNKISEKYYNDVGYWYYPDPYDPYGQTEYITYMTYYQNATATYDALNRLATWNEAGNSVAPAAYLQYEYDSAGNVRRTYAQYRTLGPTGTPSSTITSHDHYYRYDSMNRVVTDKGVLSNGTIVRGYGGTDYVYDQAGQRVRASRTVGTWGTISNPWWDPYDPYSDPNAYEYYDAEVREDYSYDSAGNLSGVRIGQSGYYDNGNGTLTVTPPPATGDLKATYYYDDMGRMTRQIDWLWNGSNAGYDRNVYYNSKGQIYYETVYSKQGSDTYSTANTHNFGSGAGYALGAVVYTTTTTSKNGSSQPSSRTDNTYYWYDGAVQATVTHKPNTSQSTTYTTNYYYTGSGTLYMAHVGDGRPRWIDFTNDMNGQVIRRDESDNSSNGDPHEVWYRFNGKQLGYTGNNGTLDTDYQTSINNRTLQPGSGAFRFGRTTGTSHVDFDQSIDPITSYNQGGAGGSYTVRAGDTLASIAASLWGDSALWYKLAEANGMSAANALNEGQRLNIPSGVMKSRHSASTFKPYDPGEVIGDASPTTPKPGKKNKCGTFGVILLVVIAVAVTALTWGAATSVFGPIIGGAVAGAAGSAASQGVGVATGIQDEFSWKGVALGALGGAVGGALGPAFSNVGNAFVEGALRGAVTSAVTQGIAVATGLQDKFDWAGVAAAAVGGGIGEWSSAKFGGMNKYAGQAASSSASAIANAATRSLINGSDFGDNLLAALPDVIGSTVGNMVSDAVMRSIRNAQVASILDITGLKAAEGDNQISKEWVHKFLENGGTLTEAVQFFSDPRINQAARQFDASQAGGITSAEASQRLEEVLARHDTRRSAAASQTEAVVAEASAAFSQVVDVYAVGPDGSSIGKNVVGGGVNLLDGLTDFYDKHPRIASIGFTATQSVLTGGPLKTIATRLAGDAFSGAVEQASNFAADKATPYLTSVAADLDWKLDLKIANTQVSIDAPQIGYGGGQLTASVVSTVLGGGIVWVVKRGRAVRDIVNPELWEVGPYNLLKGKVPGLDAHHVGQKALMKKMVQGYDGDTAPAILVPKEGHTIRGLRGIVSRSLKGLKSPRDVLARDIRELQRVYPDIPHSKLLELVRMNKSMYADAFKKAAKR